MTVASVMPAKINISTIFGFCPFVVFVAAAFELLLVLVGVWPEAVAEGELLKSELEGVNAASRLEKAAKAGGVVTIGAWKAVTVLTCVTSTSK